MARGLGRRARRGEPPSKGAQDERGEVFLPNAGYLIKPLRKTRNQRRRSLMRYLPVVVVWRRWQFRSPCSPRRAVSRPTGGRRGLIAMGTPQACSVSCRWGRESMP